MTELKKTPYKWIAARIESLDPYQDYEEIFRLTNCYYTNDFMNNLLYGVILPTLIKPEWTARAIWRENGGKILHRANVRVEDTEHHNMTWMFYGPHDQHTTSSIAQVNDLHARYEKITPGCYGHNDDYVYTLASAALTGDRFPRRLGLPGYTEKQKIVAHLFYQKLPEQFETHHAHGERKPLTGFPESWEDAEVWCERHEHTDWGPIDPRSELIAEAVWQQFAYRYFPPGLRWLGRAVQVALIAPHDLKAINAADVHPMTRMLIVWVMGWMFWLLASAPDPAPGESFVEKQNAIPKEEKTKRLKGLIAADRVFCPYFARGYKDKRPDCPYFRKLADRL
ncbi:hypothetical protein Slin14017_G109270 [Septoria linicola]|nr:hypothetical protein Slin14017_G109270 [Septoria linicola]